MKERMLITGGNALEGEVRVMAENTAVAVIPAMLLSNDPCTIENLPILKMFMPWWIFSVPGRKQTYVPGEFNRGSALRGRV